MEPGLSEVWADGVCCTGVLVQAPAERVAAALGRPLALCRQGQVSGVAAPDAVVAYAWRPRGCDWTIVQLARRLVDEGQGDYLAPLFEEAQAALAGQTAARPREALTYETPVSLAALLARALAAPAIALWGSDEWPGLSGGALLAPGGGLEEVVSAFSPAAVDRAATSRRRLQEGVEPDEEEPVARDEDAAWRWLPGRGAERVEGRAAARLDAALRARRAGFDNADLLGDLAQAIARGGPAAEATVDFWCALPPA